MVKYLEIGRIVGTHGIKGELRVDPWCDSPEFFSKFKTLYLKNGDEKLNVKSRPHKNIAIMSVKGIDTVEKADLMRGKILYINRDDAALDNNVFFIQDIIGLDVKDVDTGDLYGKVTDVIKTGANDVYQITDSENSNYLIPVIDDVVKEINVEEGYILIYPMKGIFGDED